jgi:hypothetical protein
MYLGHKNFSFHDKLGHKLLAPPNIMGHKALPMKRKPYHHFTPEPKEIPSSHLEKHHQRIRDNIHKY